MIVFNQGVLFCSQRSASQRSTRSAVPAAQYPQCSAPQRIAPHSAVPHKEKDPPHVLQLKHFFLKVNNKLIYYNIIFFKITCIIF